MRDTIKEAHTLLVSDEASGVCPLKLSYVVVFSLLSGPWVRKLRQCLDRIVSRG
jgi:hypothetical protein